jgi:hypothetical protein
VNGEKEDAKRKEHKHNFLLMSTTLFAPQGLGQKKEKKKQLKLKL